MELKKLLNFKKGSVVSIVGAGGKTSLMFSLAEELRKDCKVLVTTTTKIYEPYKEQYDFIYMLEKNYLYKNFNDSKGVYVLGKSINSEGKITSLDLFFLKEICKQFHFTLIEADGSKRRQIKGWRCGEPVVINNTNQTIGVLNIGSVGTKINESNVHRVNEFIQITNSKIDELIQTKHLTSLVFQQNGLFKNSSGERILFINKVESLEEENTAEDLVTKIQEKNNGYIDKIIIGSLKNKTYRQIV